MRLTQAHIYNLYKNTIILNNLFYLTFENYE